MSFGLPYRPPSGGWPAKPKLSAGCYQHSRADEKNVPRRENLTLVTDPSGTEAGGIAPYKRVWKNPAGCREDCETGAGLPPCAPWQPYAGHALPPDSLVSAATGTGVIDFNAYHLVDDAFEDLSKCRKIGFKAVQAQKAWHGRFGLQSHDPNGCVSELTPGSGCYYEGFQATPDDTKYRTIYYYGEHTTGPADIPPGQMGPVYDCTWTASVERQYTVDRYTGEIYLDACSDVFNSTCPGLGGPLGVGREESLATAAGVAAIRPACDGTFSTDNQIGIIIAGEWVPAVPGESATVVEFVHTNTEFTLHIDLVQLQAEGGWTKNTTKVSCKLSNPYTSQDVKDDLDTLLDEWDLTDDKIYPWRTDPFYGFAPLVNYEGIQGAISPDIGIGPCTVDDKRSPIADSNGNAPFTDGWQATYEQMPWFDPSFQQFYWNDGESESDHAAAGLRRTYLASGAIIGSPLPAGSQGHFDWQHNTWKCCNFLDGDGQPKKDYYPWAVGAKSGASGITGDATDDVMPHTATQWTENGLGDGADAWGAWMIHSGGFLRAQKWAEIKIHRPAVNFFGPCGAQRYALDEFTVRCAWKIDDTHIQTHQDMGIADGTTCAIAGVEGVADGIYTLTKTNPAPPQYAFTDTGIEPRNLPNLNPGTGIAAALRWPNAWSICGRCAIASYTDNGDGTLTVTLSAPAPCLRPGDSLDFTRSDATHREIIAYSNISVLSVLSDTSFKVSRSPFSLGTGELPNATHIKSHGAPGYWWYDDDSKGEFIVATWEHNFRDIGESDRMVFQHATLISQGCSPPALPGGIEPDESGTASTLRVAQSTRGMPRSVATFTATQESLPFNPCWPQVVCFSPNGEEFENGLTYDFPGSPALDDRYGYQWNGAVEFVIADPYWGKPNPGPASEVAGQLAVAAFHGPCVECDDNDPPFIPSKCATLEANPDNICPEDMCVDECGDDPDVPPGSYWVPMRPFVEARLAEPSPWLSGDTAPTLPADVTAQLHVLSLSELNAADEPTGVVLVPPSGLGYNACVEGEANVPDLVTMPWTIWLAEVQCVCNADNHRFAPDYEANGVTIHCPS